jgi:hypothetical protein
MRVQQRRAAHELDVPDRVHREAVGVPITFAGLAVSDLLPSYAEEWTDLVVRPLLAVMSGSSLVRCLVSMEVGSEVRVVHPTSRARIFSTWSGRRIPCGSFPRRQAARRV